MRSLGIQREPGWIGGVCAGLADRLGIDPLIVRGIVVVVAVLGGPALLLYAAAWLLLPDQNDDIHLENLLRGTFESPIAGIGVLLLLSILPTTQGFWSLGSAYWGNPSWGSGFGRALWTLVVLGLLVWFVVWISRRSRRFGISSASAPATTATAGHTETVPSREPADAAVFAIPEPLAPPAGAPAEDLAAWKNSQAAWKRERTEWRTLQADTQRVLRDQRLRESRERAVADAAVWAERRRLHRLANPPLNAATVFTVIGAAIVGGGVAALIASADSALADVSASIGFVVAALVLGVAVIVAGALGRRSGFLGFLALIAVLAALATAAVPFERQFLLPTLFSVGASQSALSSGNTPMNEGMTP